MSTPYNVRSCPYTRHLRMEGILPSSEDGTPSIPDASGTAEKAYSTRAGRSQGASRSPKSSRCPSLLGSKFFSQRKGRHDELKRLLTILCRTPPVPAFVIAIYRPSRITAVCRVGVAPNNAATTTFCFCFGLLASEQDCDPREGTDDPTEGQPLPSRHQPARRHEEFPQALHDLFS